MKAWFPIDLQQPQNYLLIFGFQLIILVVGPMINIGTDTFITGLIMHACGEFRILKKSLRALKQRALQLQHEGSGSRLQLVIVLQSRDTVYLCLSVSLSAFSMNQSFTELNPVYTRREAL
jgi:hypothetical protein